jgi:hypothetical protein
MTAAFNIFLLILNVKVSEGTKMAFCERYRLAKMQTTWDYFSTDYFQNVFHKSERLHMIMSTHRLAAPQ